MRHEFSQRTKLAAFQRAEGYCEIPWCHAKLSVGKVRYDHIIPDQMGGDNSLANCQCLCTECHADKTRKDVGDIAKSNRIRGKHLGIRPKRRSRPLPGTRASGIRRRMNGDVEYW